MDQRTDAAFSTDYLKIFIQFVKERGFLASALLDGTGIDESTIHRQPYIRQKQFVRLLRNAHTLLNDLDWGLTFGEKLQVGAHGLLGHLSISANNSLESLQAYHQYLQVRNQLVSINYQLAGESIVILFETDGDLGPYSRYIIDSCMSGFVTLLAAKLRQPLSNANIQFSYSEPLNIKEHQRILGSNITFGCQQNSIELPLSLLMTKNSSANPGVFQLVKQQSENALAQVSHQGDLEKVIVGHLMENPADFLTQQEMAIKLNLSTRTLRRRLLDLGVNYQEIQNNARKKIAMGYLENTLWSIQEISQKLGYSEEANFSRAFKRWVGVSPSEFRKSNKST